MKNKFPDFQYSLKHLDPTVYITMLTLFYGIITTKGALLGKNSIPATAEDRFKCVYLYACKRGSHTPTAKLI